MNVYDILLAKKLAGGGGVTPTGNINITDTAVTDVAAYATAQVVDGNLVADNIKKDVDILGVTGTYEGGGGGAQPQRDVNFIDYDGTILHSYTAAEFAALTAMPDNPDHSSDIQWGGHTIPLTSQGWNWSLADAKAYVAAYGKLWIGQMYVPTDGKLHLCVRMGEGRLNPASRFSFTGTATIDWGDGTDPVAAVSGSDNMHTYAAAGDYDVAIGVSEGGTLNISGDSSYGGSYLFQKPGTTTETYERVYRNCVVAAFIPNTVTSIGADAFRDCYGLKSITIPYGVTSIKNAAFRDCYGLKSATIPYGVTSIGVSLFYLCQSLQSVTIPNSVTIIESYAFYECCSLRHVTIPGTATDISNTVFKQCYSVENIIIPDGVANISSNTFEECCGMPNIVIPDSVTSIKAYAFYNCYGLGFIRFEGIEPPTVANRNAWSGVPSVDCIIYVPAASLDTYKAATNYPDPSVYTYVGY